MAAEPQLVHGAPSTMGDHEQLTTTRMLRDAARSFGDQQISYRDDSGKWQSTDYASTWDRVQRVGSALDGMGIGPDSRVGVLLWNSLEHYESYFSIPLVGATMIQLNMRLAPADLAYVILSHDEVAKLHVRHLIGGHAHLTDERLLRFEFPERPGALLTFLEKLGQQFNISLFHYRNHGAAEGRVLAGLQVGPKELPTLMHTLAQIGYPFEDVTDNVAYQLFLK